MKKLGSIVVLVLLAGGAYFTYSRSGSPAPQPPTQEPQTQTDAVEVIATDLEIPWDIAFVPNGSMLVTERTGQVTEILKDGTKVQLPVPGVRRGGEAGLLGIVLHPNFATNRFVYLYMGITAEGGETQNRVVRYWFESGQLREDKVIIAGIPGAIYHDGGRMEFGPDGKLYITAGDATRPANAQNKESLSGKILRLNDDGSIPDDNPFGTAVWSYGHRNPQGLAWDSAGNLWESEHGPTGDTGRYGHDEINLIQKGANYGWPTVVGDDTKDGLTPPKLHSDSGVWAPASLVYHGGKLYMGGLRGEALYEVTIQGTEVTSIRELFKNEYGRIRTVRVGPDGIFYLTTSNTDGRGTAGEGDDKIIRVDPTQL